MRIHHSVEGGQREKHDDCVRALAQTANASAPPLCFPIHTPLRRFVTSTSPSKQAERVNPRMKESLAQATQGSVRCSDEGRASSAVSASSLSSSRESIAAAQHASPSIMALPLNCKSTQTTDSSTVVAKLVDASAEAVSGLNALAALDEHGGQAIARLSCCSGRRQRVRT